MASQNLDVGTGANANDGQSLRSAFVNVRKMFHDVYGISSPYNDSLDISGEDFKVNANQINTTNSAASGVDGYVLTYDHATGGFTFEEYFNGDITRVQGGSGLSGDTQSGDATINIDLNDLTEAVLDVANDDIAFVDTSDSNNTRKESIADLVSAIAGSGLSASSGQLSATGSSYSVTNSSNNRVLTSVDATSGNAEADLTFDGNNLVVDGDGSTGGVTVSDGSIQMRTGTGNVAEIRMYCESNNAHYQTIKAQPHSAASSSVLTLPQETGTLIASGDTGTVSGTMIADDAVDHDQLADRFTKKTTLTGTGNLTLECDDFCTFILSGNIATSIITFNDMKQGQVVDVIFSGSDLSSAVITLADNFTTSTINKVGTSDFDTTATNHLQAVCVDDTDSAAIINYTVSSYASQTNPAS